MTTTPTTQTSMTWHALARLGKPSANSWESRGTPLSSIQTTNPPPGIAALAGDTRPPTGQADFVIMRTEGLTKQFGSRTAVQSLNLEVRRGDAFALLGPNGSGKTTTIRMALGLVLPTEGTIHLFGGDMSVTDQRQQALRRVGAIIEQPSFYPFLSGRENLQGIATFSGLARGAATDARIDSTLALVGLAARARDTYRKYSLGMKQRLGIAAALLTNPELIILDEPTNGLDPAGVAEVRALIMQLAQRGVTIILSSHLLYEVQQVCTRVAIIKEGVLLAQGSVTELLGVQNGVVIGFDDPNALFRAVQVMQSANQPWLRGAQYVRAEPGAWAPPGGWLLQVDAPANYTSAVNALLGAQGLYPAEVRRREPSLEQYFLTLTSGPMPQPMAPGAPTPAAPAPAVGAAPYPPYVPGVPGSPGLPDHPIAAESDGATLATPSAPAGYSASPMTATTPPTTSAQGDIR